MSDEQKCGRCIVAWDGSWIPCADHDESVVKFTPPLPELPEFTALETIAIPRRKTGVIVGFPNHIDAETAQTVERQLARKFPDVTFAIASGGQSVAFEWEVDE